MSLLHRLVIGERTRRLALTTGQIVPEPVRCIQCGICSYACPVCIDVRSYAWRGLPVTDSRCIRCGECAARCPRRTLRILTANGNVSFELAEDDLPLFVNEA